MVGAGFDAGFECALVAEVCAHQSEDQVFVLDKFADHRGTLFGVGHVQKARQSVKETFTIQRGSGSELLKSREQKCGATGGFSICGVKVGFEVREAGAGMKRAPALEQVADHPNALLEKLLDVVVHDDAEGSELFAAVVLGE